MYVSEKYVFDSKPLLNATPYKKSILRIRRVVPTLLVVKSNVVSLAPKIDWELLIWPCKFRTSNQIQSVRMSTYFYYGAWWIFSCYLLKASSAKIRTI